MTLKVGNLVTLNQDQYPALGDWFVQVWDGDEVAMRVYGNDNAQIFARLKQLGLMSDDVASV